MTDNKKALSTGILAGPRLDKRKDGAPKPDRADDPGPGRDDRDHLEIEIDQAEERTKAE